MQLCEYVFPVGFPLHVPKNVVFGGFEGEDVKLLSSNPQKALPCVICVVYIRFWMLRSLMLFYDTVVNVLQLNTFLDIIDQEMNELKEKSIGSCK